MTAAASVLTAPVNVAPPPPLPNAGNSAQAHAADSGSRVLPGAGAAGHSTARPEGRRPASAAKRSGSGDTRAHKRAARLAKKLQEKLPQPSGVVLQVGLAKTGDSGSGMVLKLVDRLTHQVYFRIPPDPKSPVVQRLQSNGFGAGSLVNVTA